MLRAFARRVVGDGIDPSVEVDSLNIFGLEESPAKLEAVITEQQSLAERDGSIQALLASIYLSADRAADFARYLGSHDFEVTVKLLELFGVHRSDRVCEIGGGPGSPGRSSKAGSFMSNCWNLAITSILGPDTSRPGQTPQAWSFIGTSPTGTPHRPRLMLS